MSEKKQAVHKIKSDTLKQRNKSHKNGRHKSKGEINAKGRMKLKSHGRKGISELRKADRRNQQKQLRANKRLESQQAKRQLGTLGHAPHFVVVVPLSAQVDVAQVHVLLCQSCDLDDPVPTTPPPTLVNLPMKQRFTVAYSNPSHLYSLLDTAKVADTILLVHKAGEDISEQGSFILDCLMAQGLPTTLHLVQGNDLLSGKALAAAKKAVQKSISARFPSDRVLNMDTVQQARTVLRMLSAHKDRHVLCRDRHAHLLVDRLHLTPQDEGGKGVLMVSGYVRSQPLSVNSLLHIPGLGDFQMSQIDSPCDPHPFASERANGMVVDDSQDMDEDVKVLEVADPTKQESLVSEVVPDPMAAEQTWPSEQELKEADAALREKRVVKKVPKGTSEYQAAWIVETDSEEDDDSDMDEGEGLASKGAWSDSEGALSSEEEELEEICTDTNPDTADEGVYDADIDMDQEQEQLQRLRSEREHLQFPDEVDTPIDKLAKTRFQKYRGLKSFRSSPWNPLENLPPDYARIFQFDNFNLTKKRVLRQQQEAGALPGWYVTLHVTGVPSDYAAKLTNPLIVYTLLPHENKMSVLHFVLRRANGYTLPIRSKDELVFHTGVRRFSARPTFSQHTAGDKHKFERFFPSEGCCVASVYAPIVYPPQPVLVFRHQELQGGGVRSVLVAMGSVHRVQPQRVVCKRIVLSGHPYKINKRSAVIRYMFFNREDILWFKPVELKTKQGKRGHIKEALGTHGHMKCVFDGQLKAQDTVLMHLYKRVYPRWSYNPDLATPLSWVAAGGRIGPDASREDSMED